MFVILIIVSTAVLTSALDPAGNIELADEKTRNIISKYISKIPDIEDQYIVDERLSKAISHYFGGKISSFPLYKISLKIDRNPIKIPWTLEEQNLDETKNKPTVQKQDNKLVQKHYKHQKPITNTATTKLSVSLSTDFSVENDTDSTSSSLATRETTTINTIL